MSIGETEKATQDRVVSFFKDRNILDYEYLGNLKDIANKKGIRKEDIDLSKFVHMRTILSIPSHKEIAEQEMGTFLHKKYPKITMDENDI